MKLLDTLLSIFNNRSDEGLRCSYCDGEIKQGYKYYEQFGQISSPMWVCEGCYRELLNGVEEGC